MSKKENSKSRLVLIPALSITVIAFFIIGVQSALAGQTEDAINRIKNSQHSTMPAPAQAPAYGASGKGMTIENGTEYALMIYFIGPTTRTVTVPKNESVGVELAVGSYEVAAEVKDANVVPFYGTQDYKPNMHYWLKFYLQ